MDVRNCKGCGRLFNYMPGPRLCPECRRKLEDKFQTVKEYIRDNPHAPLGTVAEENDVTVAQLKQWVREERLTFSDDSPVSLDCENCGAPIKTGRFCENCKVILHKDLNSAINKPRFEPQQKKQKDKDRMRFLDSD